MGTDLLQDHEKNLRLHLVHAAVDAIHTQLTDSKRQEHNKTTSEPRGLGALHR